MIPPAFPPTSSRQILQLYCPDSRAAGARTTKGSEGRRSWGRRGGWRGGGPCERENGQSGDKRGRNRTQHGNHNHPGLTFMPSHPIPDPCLRSAPNPGHFSAPLTTTTTTRDWTTGGAAWHHQPFWGVRGMGVAGRPCGRSCFLFFLKQQSSNESQLQRCPLMPALQWPPSTSRHLLVVLSFPVPKHEKQRIILLLSKHSFRFSF